MRTYEIGDTIVLLDEIVSIGPIAKSGSTFVFVPIFLKAGVKIMAEIRASGKDEITGQSSPFRKCFMDRFEKEYADFRKAWQDYISPKRDL